MSGFTPLEKLGLEAAAQIYFGCRRQVARTIVAFLVKEDKPMSRNQLAKYMNWPDRPAAIHTVRVVVSETNRTIRRVNFDAAITNTADPGLMGSYVMSNKAELIEQLKRTARMK